MLAHRFVDRATKDVDLFTDRDIAEALAVVRALRAALGREGLLISESPLPPQEHRFVVSDPESGLKCAVDVFADGGRLRDRVVLDVGPALHPDDLIADKVLALWARARPRDFVDVAALVNQDAGFSIPTFLDALSAMRRLTAKDWARDEVPSETAAATQRLFEGWRRWLEHPEAVRPPGHYPQSLQPGHEPPTAG